jgi:hypothetical protein
MKKGHTDNTYIFNRFEYHVEDCECEFCTNYRSAKCGRKYGKCPYDNIRKIAADNGRISRKKEAIRND